MFDGIDHVTLFGPDVDGLLALYRDRLGFATTARDRISTQRGAYHGLWRLPEGPLDVWTLEKPGSAGGGLRLVGAPGLPVPRGRRTMQRPGPFALDFYVRDLQQLYDELRADGHTFRSTPVRYELFGAGFEVTEVLLEAPLGLVHALVEYVPDRHRCVLGERSEERVSEVVAAITVVDDVEEGLSTLRDVLGGEVYLDEVFRGPPIETLIGLPPGSEFRTVLLRGPRRRNARAELMEAIRGRSAEDEPVRTFPYVALSVRLPDVDDVLGRLPPGTVVAGPFLFENGPHAGQRVGTAITGWGAMLEFVEAPLFARSTEPRQGGPVAQ